MLKRQHIETIILIGVFLICIVGWCWFSPTIQENEGNSTNSNSKTSFELESKKNYEEFVNLNGNRNSIWYDIPELGIRFKLSQEYVDDIQYDYRSLDNALHLIDGSVVGYQVVDFFSNELRKTTECDESLGRLVRYSGDFYKYKGVLWNDEKDLAYAVDSGRLIQFNNFFIETMWPWKTENAPKETTCVSKVNNNEYLHRKLDEILINRSKLLNESIIETLQEL